ncbi:MAG: hypothetical protein JOZ41_16020 [Chloroflexi bacterium]|nr:hypothetical protein [Chloroflexota bacterium]
MRGSDGGEIVPYQAVLRLIGARLDAEHARRVLLLERPGGFVVRYHRGQDDTAVHVLEFDLEDLLVDRGRGPGARRSRPVFRRGGEPGGYQDVLRALGYELERVPAYSLLLDELDDGFLVTYQHVDATGGYLIHKRMVVMGSQDRDTLLEEARSRRTHRRGLFS